MDALTSRVLRRLAVAALAAASWSAPARLDAQTSFEVRLKAAVVSKLPQFVEWPAASLDGRATIDLCVMQPNPFGPDLMDLVAGESLNGRTVAVRYVQNDQDIGGCHLLFIPDGAMHADAGRTVLRKTALLPILTIGDDDRFLDDGGIVALRVVNGRIRFDIDNAAAQRAGLRISSQLLQLALAVRGRTR